MPRTNQHFKRKNEEYIEKIKRRRAEQQQQKQDHEQKQLRLKEKLKDFVMTTVKRNVMDGLYDEEDKKPPRKTTSTRGYN